MRRGSSQASGRALKRGRISGCAAGGVEDRALACAFAFNVVARNANAGSSPSPDAPLGPPLSASVSITVMAANCRIAAIITGGWTLRMSGTAPWSV
jgi:hypothetical protein